MAYNPVTRRNSYLKNKEKAITYSTHYNRLRKLGVTKESYEALLEKQNGVCAICQGTCTKALAADHDHTTGQLRGLLCNKCNRGIGYLKDNSTLLRKAAEYIDHNRM